MSVSTAYELAVLLDTSAVIALHDPAEPRHAEARRFFVSSQHLLYCLDVTSHECFTRVRYSSSYVRALEHYQFLRENDRIRLLRLENSDEATALRLLEKYAEHALSFHDALCAAVMLRLGIPNIFSLDDDFSILGFVVYPYPI